MVSLVLRGGAGPEAPRQPPKVVSSVKPGSTGFVPKLAASVQLQAGQRAGLFHPSRRRLEVLTFSGWVDMEALAWCCYYARNLVLFFCNRAYPILCQALEAGHLQMRSNSVFGALTFSV